MTTATLPRPAERTAILSLALVFLCGGMLGALVMSLLHPRIHDVKKPVIGLTASISEWKTQLDLSDDQVRQLTSILDDFSGYYDNLLSDGNSRVLEVLTPPQRLRYQKLIREHQNK